MCLCSSGLSLSAESVVRGRVGGFAELGCSLTAPSEGATTPNLFPLHVVEWFRLGYNVPILIKFGGYTHECIPTYRGERHWQDINPFSISPARGDRGSDAAVRLLWVLDLMCFVFGAHSNVYNVIILMSNSTSQFLLFFRTSRAKVVVVVFWSKCLWLYVNMTM